MVKITTHILDTSVGKPAQNVQLKLYLQAGDGWSEVGAGVTNADGRVANLTEQELSKGIYRLHFITKPYYDQRQIATFYPYIDIIFEITESQHYHVPLLINPFGYSTYRGS